MKEVNHTVEEAAEHWLIFGSAGLARDTVGQTISVHWRSSCGQWPGAFVQYLEKAAADRFAQGSPRFGIPWSRLVGGMFACDLGMPARRKAWHRQ